MSELINKNDNRATIRWKLLTGVSALALAAYVSSNDFAYAEDSDQPQIWIELGGQLSQLQDGQETFSPPVMDSRPSIFSPSQKFEKPPSYSFDETGAISFQPEHSDWVFSVSARFGRSASNKHNVEQTNPKGIAWTGYGGTVIHNYAKAQRFADTTSRSSERHDILDFQAGKDVGLGMFGRDVTSVVNVGVRFAQFESKSNISLKSDPDWHFNYKYATFAKAYISNGQVFHSNLASLTAQRSFHGIGPSLSWKGSAPVAGNTQDGEIALDWGLNAAVLFGRQRARTHHQSTAKFFAAYLPVNKYYSVVPHTTGRFPATPDHTRSRNVTVPNVGGSVGLSYIYANAKLSFGYKADFFFGAMDGGIDTRKSENRGFYGPYASISIGLGD